MNLYDPKEHGFPQQDEFSLSGQTFGKLGQISLLARLDKRYGRVFYLVKCEECAKDPYLFGEGLFVCQKYILIRGGLPCGCSDKPEWNPEQQIKRCTREAEVKGLEFLGFKDAVYESANKTRVVLRCPEHGVFDTTTVSMLILESNGCRRCGEIATANTRIIPDDERVKSFLSTKAFHPETVFTNIGKKRKGQRDYIYWKVSCPVCNQTCESSGFSLRLGNRCCSCVYDQKLAYINIVYDGNLEVAIKFGVTSSLRKRLQQQNYWSRFRVENLFLYEFKDKYSCLNAENECKATVVCGILTKEDMSDGYTETTSLLNLDKIVRIYEKHGGVRIYLDNQTKQRDS